jgi:hypothetical protein
MRQAPAPLWLVCCAFMACSGNERETPFDAGAPDAAQELDAQLNAQLDAQDEAGNGPPSWHSAPHSSFETARRIEPDGTTHLQDELSATQVDHYVFAARAGAYYEITTDALRFSPDNRIELFDAERKQLADNDQGSAWPGDGIDARIIFRATRSEDHYVRVEDLWTPPEAFSSDLPLLFYHLRVRELASGPGVAIAGDGAPAELAVDAASGYSHALLLGAADFEEDVFELHGLAANVLVGRMLRDEVAAAGEPNDLWAEVRVTDKAGQPYAIVERAREQYDFHPPIDAADYEVHVVAKEAGRSVEAHAFYALEVVLIPDNPGELADEANATPQGSELIAMEGSSIRRGLLLATLPDESDIDYFYFQGFAGGFAQVICEAESGGSLVRGLEARLEDAEGRVVVTGSETYAFNLELVAEDLASPDVFLRLSSMTESQPEPRAAWARCGIQVAR